MNRRPRKRQFPWRPLFIGAAFIAIAAAEALLPLRKRREAVARRTARNLVLAATTAASVSLVEKPFLQPLLRAVERRRLGVLQTIELAPILRLVGGVLLLDYTLWWWHWLNHRSPLLWRFHLVHHIDRDLDASTALRFHFGEMSLSVLYRLLQIRLLGVDRQTITVWQTMLFVSIFFHHSNLRLDPRSDRLLSRFIVTPRMHGIHHSDYADETHSNWSSLFTIWDFVHGTFRDDIGQEEIEIGVPAWQNEEDVTLHPAMTIPFAEQRDDWRDDAGELRLSRR